MEVFERRWAREEHYMLDSREKIFKSLNYMQFQVFVWHFSHPVALSALNRAQSIQLWQSHCDPGDVSYHFTSNHNKADDFADKIFSNTK